MIIKSSLSVFLLIFLMSCAGIPPVQEYTLARSAISAAKKFGANKYATKSYRKAHYFYRKGQKSFGNRFYEEAREDFNLCLEYAEKSEDLTRWTRYKKGDYSL